MAKLPPTCPVEGCDSARQRKPNGEYFDQCGYHEYHRRREKRKKVIAAPVQQVVEPPPAELPTPEAPAAELLTPFEIEIERQLAAPPPAGSIEDAIAPAAAFLCELHKALSLMPRANGVSVTISISRDGRVVVTPPVFGVRS